MNMTKTVLLRSSALGLVLALSACQTTNVTSAIPGGYLSNKSDACYQERAAMDSTGNTFEAEVLRNVLIGTAVGGVTALITGQDAFVGAGIGAAAALAGTLLYDLQRQHSNPVALTDAAIANVREENERIDLLLSRFEALRECRKAEAQAVRDDLRANAITREVAEERMAGVRKRYQEDAERLDKIGQNIAKRTEGYAAVYNQVAADNGGNQLVVEEPRPRPRAASEPEPEASRERLKVLQGSNMRAGPGTDFAKVGLLGPGTIVTVLETLDGWYRIANPEGGEAFIAAFLLGPVDAPTSTPSPATTSAPIMTASARIEDRPAEKPIQDDQIDPIVLPEEDKGKVDDLQDVSLANVEKRDRVFNEVATARAEEDTDFALS